MSFMASEASMNSERKVAFKTSSLIVLSLFAVYVDDLADLCTFSRGLCIVLYADDILLL